MRTPVPTTAIPVRSQCVELIMTPLFGTGPFPTPTAPLPSGGGSGVSAHLRSLGNRAAGYTLRWVGTASAARTPVPDSSNAPSALDRAAPARDARPEHAQDPG